MVRVRAHHDDPFAILEIDVEAVKNDMAYRAVIESGIEIVPRERRAPWYGAVKAELGEME